MDALNALVNTFDTRIQNTETDVSTAVLTSEAAAASVEELRQEMAAFSETQNAAQAEIKGIVDANAALVEEMADTVETIGITQLEQEDKINTANNRVDVIVSNFTDNAQFDTADLVDLRAGYHGKTYQSAANR